MSDRCAPRHTSKTFAAGDLTMSIAAGAPIHVYGIWLFTAGTAITFSINDGAGNLIQQVYLAANSFEELSQYWIADAGIQIVASAGTNSPKATVFHNSPGR